MIHRSPVCLCTCPPSQEHASTIEELLQAHPNTKVIIDHMGFFWQDDEVNEAAWAKMLDLADYPQVGTTTQHPTQSLRRRLGPSSLSRPFLDHTARPFRLIQLHA